MSGREERKSRERLRAAAIPKHKRSGLEMVPTRFRFIVLLDKSQKIRSLVEPHGGVHRRLAVPGTLQNIPCSLCKRVWRNFEWNAPVELRFFTPHSRRD